MAEKCIFENSSEIAEYSADLINRLASEAIKERGVFTLGVSGGSIVNILAEKLGGRGTDWSTWKVFFCDERVVNFPNPDSTYGQFEAKLINKENCSSSWIKIDPTLNVEDCAKDYEGKLREEFKGEWPEFDLLLLGMGPDGHTCSLFPGHKLLQEDKLWIAAISDSPKPPPNRVTMTLPVLNHARNVAFISAGGSKADTIKAIFSEGKYEDKLPAGRVNPISGKLYWIMDKAAASKL